MGANYDFVISSINDAKPNPALGNVAAGDVELISPRDVVFLPGDVDLLATRNDGPSGERIRIVRRGSNTFAGNGVLGVDYWILNATNTGSNPHMIGADTHPTTPANDLLIVPNNAGTTSFVDLIPRGTTSTPFPGSSTVDGVNRIRIESTHVSAGITFRRMRKPVIAYHPTDRENDYLVLTSLPNNDQTYLLRRTASGTFPGSTSLDSDLLQLTKTNSTGGANEHHYSLFVKHPTDPAKDLLLFSTLQTHINAVLRGDASTPFPGGTLGTHRYIISFDGLLPRSSFDVSYHPTDPAKDLLIINNIESNSITFLYRGDDDANPFSRFLATILYADLGLADGNVTGIAVTKEVDRKDDLLIFPSPGLNSVFFFKTWEFSARPAASRFFTNLITPNSPVKVDENSVTIDGLVDFFNIDRTLFAFPEPIDSNVSWTRSTDTTATLDGDLVFQGSGEIAGNFEITMGANTNVSLGARSLYDENILLASTSTLTLTQSTELGQTFVLVSGTSVESDDGIGPYTLTIPYPDPGLVTGPGITIAAPQVTTTLTNLVEGSKIRVFVAGTTNEIAGTTAVSGTTFAFVTSLSFDLRILKNGFRAFSLLNSPAPTSNQAIQINQLIDRAYNDP
jgi:hypothetical protein